MVHKKGKPPHARGGPKWNKPWKLGRFGRRNPDAEAFGDHRRRDTADREVTEMADYRSQRSRRLFKLVRAGPLVPRGGRIEIIRPEDRRTEEVQPLAPEHEILLGHLRLDDDGTLSYEEVLADANRNPETILDQVLDILGPNFHEPSRGFSSGARIRRGSHDLVAPKLLNYVHSMGNHLSDLQWRELDPADRE